MASGQNTVCVRCVCSTIKLLLWSEMVCERASGASYANHYMDDTFVKSHFIMSIKCTDCFAFFAFLKSSGVGCAAAPVDDPRLPPSHGWPSMNLFVFGCWFWLYSQWSIVWLFFRVGSSRRHCSCNGFHRLYAVAHARLSLSSLIVFKCTRFACVCVCVRGDVQTCFCSCSVVVRPIPRWWATDLIYLHLIFSPPIRCMHAARSYLSQSNDIKWTKKVHSN